MEALNVLVIELVTLAILAVFLELLIPSGELSRYVRMVLGLLIIVAVLQAATSLWHRELALDFGNLSLQPTAPAVGDGGILDEGRRRWEENQAYALEEYRAGLARQIMALTRLNPEVEINEVIVELNEDDPTAEIGSIRSVTLITGSNSGKDGDLAVSGDLDDTLKESLERLRGTIAEFYNLEPESVRYEIK